MLFMAAVETWEEEVRRMQDAEEMCRQRAAKAPPGRRARVYRDCLLRVLGGL